MTTQGRHFCVYVTLKKTILNAKNAGVDIPVIHTS